MIVLDIPNGALIGIVHGCLEQELTNSLDQIGLTSAQSRILGFISRSKTPPCARDIEERFHLSHPTVSGLLSRMESKEFIVIRPDETDRRIKRIYSLPKAEQCRTQMETAIRGLEDRLIEGFTPEEAEQFSRLLSRAARNLGVNLSNPLHKEEAK